MPTASAANRTSARSRSRCALAHLDFRFAADTWREGRPRLARWHAEFAKRPSMQATEHADTY